MRPYGTKTLAAKDGRPNGPSVTGHAGRTPGKATAARTVDHPGAAGAPVTPGAELTDACGESVVQTVNSAYSVR